MDASAKAEVDYIIGQQVKKPRLGLTTEQWSAVIAHCHKLVRPHLKSLPGFHPLNDAVKLFGEQYVPVRGAARIPAGFVIGTQCRRVVPVLPWSQDGDEDVKQCTLWISRDGRWIETASVFGLVPGKGWTRKSCVVSIHAGDGLMGLLMDPEFRNGYAHKVVVALCDLMKEGVIQRTQQVEEWQEPLAALSGIVARLTA